MEPSIPEKLPIRDVNWEPLIPIIGRASRAIARYDGVLEGVPNPWVLLSPLTTQEAVLSSKIEGTQATLGEVLRFEAGDQPAEEERRRDIQEILNYRKALRVAEEELSTRPFNLNLLLRLHDILLDSARGRHMMRGHFRTTQNWIGAPGTPIEQAKFVPPAPTRLAECLSDWEKYCHMSRPDPLVQLAVVHAQFEVIHPFLDGNGRIGRMLVPLFLFEKKLLSRPALYISSWLDAHRDDYNLRLRNLGQRPGAWNSWVEFFLTAVEEQSRLNADKARAIMELYHQIKGRIFGLTGSRFAVPLLDQMFDKPVFEAAQLTFPAPHPSKPSVMNLLKLLHDNGVLKVLREGAGRRGTVYGFAELVNLCEDRQVM